MPIYHVKPIVAALEDPAWQSSNTRAECWVNAANVAEARGLVSGRYENAEVNIPGHSRGPSPWQDPRLVEVREVDGPPNGARLPSGVIMDSQQS
jgi:hypothetical protein